MAPSIIASLPAIKTVEDCADFDKVVAPHLPQLQNFYENLLQSLSSGEQLQQFYISTNPLVTSFVFSLALAPIFLVASEVNRNYSQVDRFWSILPSLHAIHYAVWTRLSGLPHQKSDLVAALGVIWTIRLTFNYWRRGGYNIGSEDYRWNIIKAQVHPALFFLFNVTFISTIQSILLFSIHTPTYLLLNAARVTGEGLAVADWTFAAAILSAITISAIADQQQWDYHAAKATYQTTARVPKGYARDDMERGFNTTGLWYWSRHPNFAAEQSVWVLLFLWGCVTSKTYFNWTGVGAISYLALFQGSTWLTEKISSGKYPEYGEYQKRVGRFLPSAFTYFTGPVGEKTQKAKKPTRAASTKKRTSAAADGKSK